MGKFQAYGNDIETPVLQRMIALVKQYDLAFRNDQANAGKVPLHQRFVFYVFTLLLNSLLFSITANAESVQADGKTPTVARLLVDDQTLSRILPHGPWPMQLKTDLSNRLSGNADGIEFGRRLFVSTRLSGDNKMSCVSCHASEDAFASGRIIKENKLPLDRNTLSLLNVRFNHWFGWDGSNDNLWAQSMRPIVSDKEMNLPSKKLRKVIEKSTFLKPYTQFFGEVSEHTDDAVLVNIGKALAAYQETLVTNKTSFDHFRDAVASQDWMQAAKYPEPAQRGLSLFMGRGNCSFCHSGPLFSNGEFHGTGVPYFVRPGVVDSGRHQGISNLKQSLFTLESDFNDAPEKSGAWAGRKVVTLGSNFGIFRVPSLRNLSRTAPYMHNGAIETLEGVVNHYNHIDMEQPHSNGEAILKPLDLSRQEVTDLVTFLNSLSN